MTKVTMTGRRVGCYRIGRLIAEGRVAQVYRARDLVLGRPVAFKISRVATRASGSELIDEARAVASVTHESVVRIYSAGWVGEHAYLALELIGGRTLEAALTEAGRFPWRRALLHLADLASGLAAIHAVGVVHGDIKPGNVLLDPARPHPRSTEGLAVITDLGIPRRWRKPGLYFGTPSYSSPEHCHEHGRLDERSDLFSLGIVFYEMLSGRPPFDEPATQGSALCSHATSAIFGRILAGERASILDLVPRLPRAVVRLLDDMLALDPARRPTAHQVECRARRILARRLSRPGRRGRPRQVA